MTLLVTVKSTYSARYLRKIFFIFIFCLVSVASPAWPVTVTVIIIPLRSPSPESPARLCSGAPDAGQGLVRYYADSQPRCLATRLSHHPHLIRIITQSFQPDGQGWLRAGAH